MKKEIWNLGPFINNAIIALLVSQGNYSFRHVAFTTQKFRKISCSYWLPVAPPPFTTPSFWQYLWTSVSSLSHHPDKRERQCSNLLTAPLPSPLQCHSPPLAGSRHAPDLFDSRPPPGQEEQNVKTLQRSRISSGCYVISVWLCAKIASLKHFENIFKDGSQRI